MSEDRSTAVEETLAIVRDLMASGPDRELLGGARDALVALAKRRELWSAADFPPPEGEDRQARYRIAQDAPDGLTLYLNVMKPGNKIPPHDHTTWACIAAVEGAETNVLWDRVDDGAVPGKAELRQTGSITVGPEGVPGAEPAIALMPDDIHHVEIRDAGMIRHLHMYGRPLESLTERTAYDPEAGTCRTMSIGVKTRG